MPRNVVKPGKALLIGPGVVATAGAGVVWPGPDVVGVPGGGDDDGSPAELLDAVGRSTAEATFDPPVSFPAATAHTTRPTTATTTTARVRRNA